MSGTGINMHGNARATFQNTIVGDNARMTVHQTADVHARLSELLAAIEAHRAELSEQVAHEAKAAEAELAQPEPRVDRLVQAMERIREGAASVTAIVAAAGAVLKALGVA